MTRPARFVANCVTEAAGDVEWYFSGPQSSPSSESTGSTNGGGVWLFLNGDGGRAAWGGSRWP